MTNLRYTSELIDDVLERAGELTDGSSPFEAVALKQINRIYRAIWNGGAEINPRVKEDWLWLKTHLTLVLQPKQSLSMDATKNNAAITFTTAPADSLAGWFLRSDSYRDVFRIASHSGGSSSATLDAVWTGENVTGLAVTCFKLEYDLGVTPLKMKDPMIISQIPVESPWPNEGKVYGVDEEVLTANWPIARTREAIPSHFAHVTETKVRFNSYPSDLLRVEVPYYQLPNDLENTGSDEALLPLQFRYLLSDGALYHIYLDKNDDRADSASLSLQAGLEAMKNYNRRRQEQQSNAYGHIYPRLAQVQFTRPRGYR